MGPAKKLVISFFTIGIKLFYIAWWLRSPQPPLDFIFHYSLLVTLSAVEVHYSPLSTSTLHAAALERNLGLVVAHTFLKSSLARYASRSLSCSHLL